MSRFLVRLALVVGVVGLMFSVRWAAFAGFWLCTLAVQVLKRVEYERGDWLKEMDVAEWVWFASAFASIVWLANPTGKSI